MMDFEHWPVLAGFAGFLAVFSRDPLGHVPGPWSAKFTGLPAVWAELRGRKAHHYSYLHSVYGPVVRISPSQVSFGDFESFKAIHRIGSHFKKDTAYRFFNASFGKYDSILSIRDIKFHNERRRLFAKAMSANHLRKNWQDVVSERAIFAVKCIRNDLDGSIAMGKGQADLAKWWRLLASDITSWLSFGSSFECLEKGQLAPYMRAIKKIPLAAILYLSTGHSLYGIIERLPWPKFIREVVDVPKLLMTQGVVAVTHSKGSSTTKNVFADAVSQCKEEGGSLPDADIQTEAGTFIAAGTETTSDALQCMMWSVLSQPDLQKSLEDEVSSTDDLSDESLEKLPILGAVINETLRLYSGGSGPLLRLAPPGGATVHGVFIPENTVVTAPAYVFHRDPVIFPDPLKFDHTRFLPENSPATKTQFMAPFSRGAQNCIGISLALMVIRRTAAEFFRECKGTTLAPSMRDVKLELISRVISVSPAYPKLDVIWRDE